MTTATGESLSRGSLSEAWWLFLLQGIATLILGLLFLISPGMTLAVAVAFMGTWWLVGGIFSIVGIFLPHRSVPWGWLLFNGILGILAGIAVLNHPLLVTVLIPTVLVIFIAVDGIIFGVIGLIQAFQGGGLGSGVWGVISILFGIILLARPVAAAGVLPIVAGVFGLIGGVALIVLAFRLRSA